MTGSGLSGICGATNKHSRPDAATFSISYLAPGSANGRNGGIGCRRYPCREGPLLGKIAARWLPNRFVPILAPSTVHPSRIGGYSASPDLARIPKIGGGLREGINFRGLTRAPTWYSPKQRAQIETLLLRRRSAGRRSSRRSRLPGWDSRATLAAAGSRVVEPT